MQKSAGLPSLKESKVRLFQREICVPATHGNKNPVKHLEESVRAQLSDGELPVRVAVTSSDKRESHCELGVLADIGDFPCDRPRSIFQYVPRDGENTGSFNAVLLVPTGIGAKIGGHAGDAGPVATLLGSLCDTLITHPNVVNASDINELPENGLYVEGSVISRLMMGTVGLQKVRSNRVLVVMDVHDEGRMADFTINAISAARATLGLDCPRVVKMDAPVRMCGAYSSSGSAAGRVDGLERLCRVLYRHRGEYDAVALTSVIEVPSDCHQKYFGSPGEMVNPWGGVEAMLTHAVSMIFDVPSAHAPMMESSEILNLDLGVVDPRMAAEAVSTAFLHCVLKGLHRAPRIVSDPTAIVSPEILSAADVSCLVIPDGCVGLPTLAALEQGIPVIAVRENRNLMRNDLTALPFSPDKLFVVDNYLDAAGVMTALRAGVSLESVRRPLADTKVLVERQEEHPAPEESTKTTGASR